MKQLLHYKKLKEECSSMPLPPIPDQVKFSPRFNLPVLDDYNKSSFPESYWSKWTKRTLDMVLPGSSWVSSMALRDLAARANFPHKHIHVHEDDLNLQVIKWGDCFFVELKLIFGGRSSPGIFYDLAKVFLWCCMALSGMPRYAVEQHIDDLLGVGLPTWRKLRRLGSSLITLILRRNNKSLQILLWP